MKPFDLERALAGDPIVTRDGRKVLELHLFKYVDEIYVCIEGINEALWFNHEGKCNLYKETENDLFMDYKKKKLYIGISIEADSFFKNRNDIKFDNYYGHSSTWAFYSLENLKIFMEFNKINLDYFKIIEIEIEE